MSTPQTLLSLAGNGATSVIRRCGAEIAIAMLGLAVRLALPAWYPHLADCSGMPNDFRGKTTTLKVRYRCVMSMA